MKGSTKRLLVAATVLIIVPLLGLIVLLAKNRLDKDARAREANYKTVTYNGLEGVEVHKITVDGQDYIVVKYYCNGVAICPVPPKKEKLDE